MTGAGVVLAQRLEQLAPAGGVVAQGAVCETVPTRLPFDYNNLGEQQLKGFDQPVRAFLVSLKPGACVPLPESAPEPVADSGKPRASHDTEIPDKPSVAVLPFENLSSDAEQEYSLTE